jgi:uncharacterized protein YqjF (DUF2071 family)
MRQRWHDLLFAHWPVDREALRRIVPLDFEIDLFDGRAWVGVVPFTMSHVTARGVPALPWVSAFPEVNVRTYVRAGDRPGIYFFSLDAGRWLAVRAARWWLNLPYYHASMAVALRSARVEYDSRRFSSRSADLSLSYAPTGQAFVPAPGTLEYFLTERYCLYQRDHRGRPYRLEIHHPPWSLQLARADFFRNTLAEASGITLPPTPPLLHSAGYQQMVGWAPEFL